LKFLGNIPSKRVAEITEAIEKAAQGISPFHLEISGGGFSQPEASSGLLGRHRWGGGQAIQVTAKHRLRARRLGICKEERSFVPHLTLARIRQGASPLERRSFGELVGSTIFEDKYMSKSRLSA